MLQKYSANSSSPKAPAFLFPLSFHSYWKDLPATSFLITPFGFLTRYPRIILFSSIPLADSSGSLKCVPRAPCASASRALNYSLLSCPLYHLRTRGAVFLISLLSFSSLALPPIWPQCTKINSVSI